MKCQFIIVILHFSYIFGDHYEILGISRSSTDFDIKKAYKKLARIWHPDKSKLPEANEKFMQINEAYEVLSDPEKRKEYDAFGTVSNEPRGNDGFHRGTFWHSNFGSTFFQTDEDTRDTRFETVDFRHFKMNIVPDSIKKPSLILLVTHFCVACHHAIRLWGNIADQVSDSGIRMGISDVMRDSRLREELKVHHVPSVIFIIDGQSKYMQADISKETIIEFLRQSFPRDLITYIYSEDDLNRFHDSWMKDSRSKMSMTKPLDRASFRYLSLAYKYRDKISAGFIYLDENNKSPLKNIVNSYRLDYDEETLLIFHDEKQSYNKISLPKPVTQIAKSRLSINEMEYLIEANNQLPLSRLLSQSVFDRSCPPPSQKHQSFGFCVIAVVHSKHGSNLSEAENWQYLRSLVDDRNRGKMLYLYGDVQFEFLKSLQLFDQSTIVDVNVFIDQVILLWRQSYESAASIFLSNPWEYPNLDWVLTNWNLLSNLDTAVPILKTKHRIQSKLADSESLTELVDELASPLMWRILARFISYIQQIITFLYENLLDPFTIIIIVLAFVLLSYSYSTMKSVSQHLSEENDNRSRKTKPSNTGKGCKFKNVQELTNTHYNRLLTNSQKGNLVVVMFTTDLTPPKPVEIMVDGISHFKCHIPIEPLYLRLDTYKNWPSSILGLISEQEDQNQAVATISSLSNNRPFSKEGIVLALNIVRCYLCICPINMLRDSPFPYKKNDELHFRKRNLLNATYYLDSDSSESEGPVVSLDKNDSLENKFCDWLCQLTDGTCKRYRLKQWPDHL